MAAALVLPVCVKDHNKYVATLDCGFIGLCHYVLFAFFVFLFRTSMMFTFVFLLLFVLFSLSVASVFVSFLVSLFLFLTILSFSILSVYYS